MKSFRRFEEAPARWIVDRGFPTKGVIAGFDHRKADTSSGVKIIEGPHSCGQKNGLRSTGAKNAPDPLMVESAVVTQQWTQPDGREGWR